MGSNGGKSEKRMSDVGHLLVNLWKTYLNIMELLKIPFQEISHKNNPKLENYKKCRDLSFFPGFL